MNLRIPQGPSFRPIPFIAASAMTVTACASSPISFAMVGLTLLASVGVGAGMFAVARRRDQQLEGQADSLYGLSMEAKEKYDWESCYQHAEGAYEASLKRFTGVGAVGDARAIPQFFKVAEHFFDLNRNGSRGGCPFEKEIQKVGSLPMEMVSVALRYGHKDWAVKMLSSALQRLLYTSGPPELGGRLQEWSDLTFKLHGDLIRESKTIEKRQEWMKEQAEFFSLLKWDELSEASFHELALSYDQSGCYEDAYRAMSRCTKLVDPESLETGYQKAVSQLEEKKKDASEDVAKEASFSLYLIHSLHARFVEREDPWRSAQLLIQSSQEYNYSVGSHHSLSNRYQTFRSISGMAERSLSEEDYFMAGRLYELAAAALPWEMRPGIMGERMLSIAEDYVAALVHAYLSFHHAHTADSEFSQKRLLSELQKVADKIPVYHELAEDETDGIKVLPNAQVVDLAVHQMLDSVKNAIASIFISQKAGSDATLEDREHVRNITRDLVRLLPKTEYYHAVEYLIHSINPHKERKLKPANDNVFDTSEEFFI